MKEILLYLFLFTSFSLISCQSNGYKEEKLKKPNAIDIVGDEVNLKQYFPLSLFSLFQANNSGLAVTLAKPIDKKLLLFIPTKTNSICCQSVKKLIREGRGPNEMVNIQHSSKTFNADTLLFYSSAEQKYFLYNQEMQKISTWNHIFQHKSVSNSFTYSNGYLFSAIDPMLGEKGNLIQIYNKEKEEVKDTFKARVPQGYQPAIRNFISASASLPDGFVFSFVGDQKLYIMNYKGEVSNEIILGKSDPIGEPYKIQDPMSAPSGTPYIPKIEFHNDHLFVLLNQELWILTYPEFKALRRLRVLEEPDQKQLRVTDFSLSDNLLYVRMGRNQIFQVTINPNWFIK